MIGYEIVKDMTITCLKREESDNKKARERGAREGQGEGGPSRSHEEPGPGRRTNEEP
jgi:hypothetical protein